MVKKYFLSAKEKAQNFKKEFRKQATIAIIAAFGFIIALSWQDFISGTTSKIVESLGMSDKAYLYKLLSAIVVTIIAIIGIILVSKLQVKEQEKTA